MANANDSNHARYRRRLKRELTLAYRMIDQLINEREVSRAIIQGMANHIEKLEVPKTEEAPVGEVVTE